MGVASACARLALRRPVQFPFEPVLRGASGANGAAGSCTRRRACGHGVRVWRPAVSNTQRGSYKAHVGDGRRAGTTAASSWGECRAAPPGAYEAPGCEPDVNTNAVMSSGRMVKSAVMGVASSSCTTLVLLIFVFWTAMLDW